MKIALIGPRYPYRGSIALYTDRLAHALSGRHEVKVFPSQRQYPAWLYPSRSVKYPNQKAINVGAAYIIDSLNPLTWLRTTSDSRRFQPNVLILEWWVTLWASAIITIAFLCRQSLFPVAFLIYNMLPHEKSWLHRPLAWITLRRAIK